MARPGRRERNRAARSFHQLRRFHHVINSDKVFGTHREELSTKYVFRFAVELGHCSTESACLMSAHLPLVVRWALARADSIGIAGRALTSSEGSRRRPSDRQP